MNNKKKNEGQTDFSYYGLYRKYPFYYIFFRGIRKYMG